MSDTLVAKVKGGPVTESGKAVARLNGVVHGLRAVVPVIATEREEDWEQHRTGIVDELAPTGALEMELAERVALLLWRMRRVARYEANVAGAAQEDAESDYVERQEEKHRHSHTYISYAPDELRKDLRMYPARARFLRRLATLDADKRVAGEDASDILQECERNAVFHDDEFDADAVDYPGLPEAGFDWDEFPDITVSVLRDCIAAIAAVAKTDPEALTAGTAYHYECETRGAKMRLAEAEQTISRWRERRALLPVEHLDKVMRYETHLHRQLVQTLRELEAIQARRLGQAAPLARLDVSGMDSAP